MLRKIILGIIGLVLIIASIFIAKYIVSSNLKDRPKPQKIVKTVIVDTVKNNVVPIDIKAQGNLIASRRLELYAEVQGILNSGNKLFRPGQIYAQGETLININNEEYYATVQSQKSALYNSITAIMPDLKLDYPNSFEKWQRYLNNFNIKKGTPPLPEITDDKERYFIAGRNIQTVYFNLKTLEERLSKYRITAPFSGTLTESLVTEGTLIRTGQKLGEFIDTNNYELEVAISQTYASLLRLGKDVQLRTLNGDKTYSGRVVRVNANVDATSQTVNAYIAVRGNDLKEGVYLEASLMAKEVPNAYSLDRGLLQPDDQVFIVKGNKLDLINVTPIYFSEKQVVLTGIPDGTIILNKAVSGAYKGMIIKKQDNNPILKKQ